MSNRYFRCCCCGVGFRSAKPQDPDRDTGFGKCAECLPRLVADLVKYGFAGRPQSEEQARNRLEPYA